MSGHSKWATIKRKKSVLDAKRGKLFTQLIKELSIAARSGGGNPEGNPRLRLAIDNAKAANMPNDNIERAIKKATGELEGVHYEEFTYEGYGPGGIAILVDVVTDNKNRTVSEIRHIFSKHNGRLAEIGSVNYMFHKKGIITIDKSKITEDELMEIALDAGADDIINDDEFFIVQTSVEFFESVRKAIADKNIKPENASLSMVPQNMIQVDSKENEIVIKLLESIEEHDDVQNLYTNADINE